MAETRESVVDSLLELIEAFPDEELRTFLVDYRPVDLATALGRLPEERAIRIFSCLDEELAADVLAEADEELAALLTEGIPEEDLSDILEEMEPDDAADVLGDIEDESRARRVLDLMADVERGEVEGLLVHDEETAGGIMTSEYLAFPETWTVQSTIEFLRQAPPEIHFNTAFTLDEEGRLKGLIPIQALVWSAPERTLKEIADRDVISVTVDTDQEEVARLFARYDLLTLPVIDSEGRLTGRITVDDVLDVVQEENSEDMFKLAGSSDEELVTRSALSVIGMRLPWLLVALAGGFACAMILGVFEQELSHYTYLAFYLPVIMSMGGNIGTQSSTLIVRGLATGQIESGELIGTILKEVRVGAMIGVVCGFLAGAFGAFYAGLHGNPSKAGFIVALSMSASMTTSTLFASTIPLTFSRLRIDPAVASGPFISMFNDALGLVIYLSSIRLLSSHFPV